MNRQEGAKMTVNFQNTIFAGVSANIKDCPQVDVPEIILSGRSNVGKSSLVNALAGNGRLARISSTPGKTRLIVYFQVDRQLLLTDLPGYGYASLSRGKRAAYSQLADQYLNSGRPIALVLHLLDIRHAPSADDLLMLDWLQRSGIPCRIVLTKADKLNRSQIQQARLAIAMALGLDDPASLIAFSAEIGTGVHELRALLSSLRL
jgi:GTP-binding protein